MVFASLNIHEIRHEVDEYYVLGMTKTMNPSYRKSHFLTKNYLLITISERHDPSEGFADLFWYLINAVVAIAKITGYCPGIAPACLQKSQKPICLVFMSKFYKCLRCFEVTPGADNEPESIV